MGNIPVRQGAVSSPRHGARPSAAAGVFVGPAVSEDSLTCVYRNLLCRRRALSPFSEVRYEPSDCERCGGWFVPVGARLAF